MNYNPDIHHRRSIRLPKYDYTQAGAYFVTICIFQQECLLGEIKEGQVILSPYGEAVKYNWFNLTRVYPHIELNTFVIMPNHLHGIIIIKQQRHGLSEILRGLKTFSARRINQLRSISGIPVWQRGYYEHIIRHETAFTKIQEYIINNPYKWEMDEMHPSQTMTTPTQINIKLDNINKVAMNFRA